MSNKIVLVRSPIELIYDGLIGYGWPNVNFSKYETTRELLEKGFNNIDIGRKGNQIKRYFNLEKGDIIVVPVPRAIAIGIVEGTKIFIPNTTIRYSENRVKVNFILVNEKYKFIPRDDLSNALESRLKIRTTIASLENFRDEIENLVQELEKGGILTWNEKAISKEAEAEKIFKNNLLDRIKSGEGIGLSAGGYGLEKLIEELLIIKGYKDTKIMAKNQSSGIDDIDIIAIRDNEITGIEEKLLIQAKHHRGNTSSHGLNQLIAHISDGDESIVTKILITTGKIDDIVLEKAAKENIIIIDGEAFVDLIYQNIDLLSEETKRKLGVSMIPTLL